MEYVEMMDLPEIALRYFDYDKYAGELEAEGWTEVSGGVIVVD